MSLVLIIVLVVLLFGGGGAFYGSRAGWGGPHYGGGLLGLVVLILLILWLTGNLGGGRVLPLSEPTAIQPPANGACAEPCREVSLSAEPQPVCRWSCP